MKVMDNKLFAVDPMKGVLEPGECHTVTLSYKHIIAGTDRLPVLLKLARGREILVSIAETDRLPVRLKLAHGREILVSVAGTDRLPVRLKLACGREILVSIAGTDKLPVRLKLAEAGRYS